MKLSIILLIATILQASASTGYAQKITLSEKNAPLEKVLKEIREQSGYDFFYNSKLIKQANPVSISVQNTELDEVLKLAFTGQPFIYSINDNTIIIKPKPINLITQPIAAIKISGTVTDSKGPLPGASVRIKGTSKGTITNIDGKFTIEADPNSVLVVSFAGFITREIAVTAGISPLTIQLKEDNTALNEVVVVAYGKQKKLTITGAVTTVNVADVTTSERSLSNALAGKVAGVISVQRSGEPGYDNASFTIRGIGTFTGNSTPLIIIDGVQRDDVNSTYGGAYNNIDPEDIQSISILKDASSTALYGAKGANGVLIITTKKGVAGDPKISLKIESSMSGLTKTPKMLDAVSWMQLYNEASTNGGGPVVYSQETIDKTKSGLDPYLYPNVDWINSVYKKWAPGYNANLNVTGGAKSVRYYVSSSFYDQDGSYKVTSQNGYNPNLNFKRYDFRTNVDIDVSKTTLLSMNLDAMLVSSRYPGLSASSVWYEAYSTPPNAYPIKYPDGKWAGPYNNGGSNPANDVQNSGYTTEFHPAIQSVFSLTQNLDSFTKGLSALARFSFDSYSESDNNRTGADDLYLATGRDAQGNLIYGRSRIGQQFLGFGTSTSAEKTMYLETNVTYDCAFGKSRFGGLFLYNMRSRILSTAGDVINSIPYNNQGMAGRITYGYDDRYLAEINAGYTGSENFQPGKRFGFFPSVSAAWVISRESFFKDLAKSVNLFKIRGSHGVVGNDQIGSRYGLSRFPYITQYGGGSNIQLGYNGTSFSSIKENIIGVQNLTWEKSTKDDIGLELGLFNKISITIDAFRERRKDILVARSSLSSILGVSGTIFSNLGEMSNHGIDANIEYNQNFGKVSVRLYGNFTYNNNKIIQQDEPKQLYAYQQSTGHKFGDNLVYVSEGLFRDQADIDKSPSQFGSFLRPGDIKYKDVNGDGVIDSYDRVYTGKSDIPTILYGSGFTVGYHDFDFSMFFQGTANVMIMANGAAITGPSGTSSGVGIVPFTGSGSYSSGALAIIANRWTPDNPSQNVAYPRLGISNQNSNNYQPSTWWQKDGSYVRLKQASLGYKYTSESLKKKMGLGSIYLYVSGQNILTFSKFKLWDPELGSDGAGYPPVRIFALGLKAAF
ncbi:TonB-dependent receptor [Mucilaginibacter sp. BJC16-A38]|uniref:TonB-dependent receptor n=1 Tax=Mucilaginibacter phenanthrenivorans TaxID=1234842 RepID=UPI00215899AC|nr:TonB-dependent receptor [Mucilaginibacter phenanthrenivorans]MCR8557195.1 TonB-dependent receptor [Mucilaginibacter phenanthrenivorans]